jgi:hypothetical protein
MVSRHSFLADESNIEEEEEQEKSITIQEKEDTDPSEEGESLVEEMIERHGGMIGRGGDGGEGVGGERGRRVSFAPTACIRHFQEESSFGGSVLLSDDGMGETADSSILSGQTFVSGDEGGQEEGEESSIYLGDTRVRIAASTSREEAAMTAFLESSVLLGDDMLEDGSSMMMGNVSTATCFGEEADLEGDDAKEEGEQGQPSSMMLAGANEEENVKDATAVIGALDTGGEGWMQETRVLFANQGCHPSEATVLPDRSTAAAASVYPPHAIAHRPAAMDMTQAIVPMDTATLSKILSEASFSENAAPTTFASAADMESDHLAALQEEERVMAGYVDLGAMAQTQVIRSIYSENINSEEAMNPTPASRDAAHNREEDVGGLLLPLTMDETRVISSDMLQVAQATLQNLSFSSPSRDDAHPITCMEETQLVQSLAEEPNAARVDYVARHPSEPLIASQAPIDVDSPPPDAASLSLPSQSQLDGNTGRDDPLLPSQPSSLSSFASPANNKTPQSARLKRFPGLGSPLKNPILQAAKTPTARPSLGSPLRTPQKLEHLEPPHIHVESLIPHAHEGSSRIDNVNNASSPLHSANHGAKSLQRMDERSSFSELVLTPSRRQKRRKRSSLIWDVHSPVFLPEEPSNLVLPSIEQLQVMQGQASVVRYAAGTLTDMQVPIKPSQVVPRVISRSSSVNADVQDVVDIGNNTPSRWQHYSTPLQSRIQGLTGSPRVRTLSEYVAQESGNEGETSHVVSDEPQTTGSLAIAGDPKNIQSAEAFLSSPLVQRKGKTAAADLVFIGDVTADLFVGSPMPIKRRPSLILGGTGDTTPNDSNTMSTSGAVSLANTAASVKRKSVQGDYKIQPRRSSNLTLQAGGRPSIGATFVSPTISLATWLDMHNIRFLDCGDPVGRPTLIAHRPTELPFIPPSRILYIFAVVKQSVAALLTRNTFVAMRVQELREGIARRASQFSLYPPPLYQLENRDTENKESYKRELKGVDSIRTILRQFKAKARHHAVQAWHAWRLDQAAHELEGLQATLKAHQETLEDETQHAARLSQQRTNISERLVALRLEQTRLRKLKARAANTDWAALEALTRDTADVQRVASDCNLRLRHLRDVAMPAAQQHLSNLQEIRTRLASQRQELVAACYVARHAISPVDLSLARSRFILLTRCLPFHVPPSLVGAFDARLSTGLNAALDQRSHQKMDQLDQKMDQFLYDQMVIKEKKALRLVWRAAYRHYDIFVHLVVSEREEQKGDQIGHRLTEEPPFWLYMVSVPQEKKKTLASSGPDTPFGHELLTCFTQHLLPPFLLVREPKTPAQALAIAFQELAHLHALDVELAHLVCLYRITLSLDGNHSTEREGVHSGTGMLTFHLSFPSTTHHRTLHFLVNLIPRSSGTLSEPNFTVACVTDPDLDVYSVCQPVPPSLTLLCHRLAALAN